MLQKMEQDQGFDIKNNLKLKMRLSRIQNEDPSILILKRRVQDMLEEVEACEKEIKKIEGLGKERIQSKEERIDELSKKCKRLIIDVHNNIDLERDGDHLTRLQDMRNLDHESGLYIDVLQDEHKAVTESLRITKDTNLTLRIKLDKNKLALNALKRAIIEEEEKADKKDFDFDRLKKQLGKDGSDMSEEDEMYDDHTTIARKRERKMKKIIGLEAVNSEKKETNLQL